MIINQVQKGKKQKILDYLEKLGVSTSTQLCEKLGISRQAFNLHVRELISNGSVIKTGSTRAARYYLAESSPKAEKFNKTVKLANLDESAVYEELATILNLKSVLSADQESSCIMDSPKCSIMPLIIPKRTNAKFLSVSMQQTLNSQFGTVESGFITRLPPGFHCRTNTQP